MPKPLTVVNDKVLALALANQFLVLLVRHLLKDGIVLLLDLRRERDWSFAHTKELAANSRGQGRRARKPHGAVDYTVLTGAIPLHEGAMSVKGVCNLRTVQKY